MSNVTRKIMRAQESKAELPDTVGEADYWRWQAQANAVMRIRAELAKAEADLRVLEPEHQRATQAFFAKYGIKPGDQINSDTLKITRGVQAIENETPEVPES